MLADAPPGHRSLAATNEAWVLLDRGNARQAEAAFASLAFQAERDGNDIGAKFHNVYRARALYQTGQFHDASNILDGIDATEGALGFLAQLARTEGAGWFEDWERAATEADALFEIVMRDLPQWENIGRYHRARTQLQLGDTQGAREEVERALTACPPGPDGWRWRQRCRALALRIDHAATGTWDQATAENLTDELLVARWFDVACELMVVRAEVENDTELALQAAGLADSVGNPLLAIRAVHAGDLWTDSRSGSVIGYAKTVAATGPKHWPELPQAAAALQAEAPVVDADQDSLVDALNETMRAIGLEGSGVTPDAGTTTGSRSRSRVATRCQNLAVGSVPQSPRWPSLAYLSERRWRYNPMLLLPTTIIVSRHYRTRRAVRQRS